LTYDVENRLVQAQNLITTSQYLYDPLGNRKQKQVQMGGGSVITQFLVAGGEEIADYNCYNGTCTPWVLTVRGPGGLPVAAITPASGSQAETVVFYHHDVMGSTVASTVPGLSGAAEAYVYSDFGAPAGGSYLAYQFAGYRYDSETGLYYVHARYYNPILGRFLQTDPIGTAGGNNLYAYVGNDPINLFDPTGLSQQETGNDSNGVEDLSQQGLSKIASGVVLAPVTDHTPGDNGVIRSILYQVQYANGDSYTVDNNHPTLYVSEIISGSQPGGTVPTGNGTFTSTDPQGDEFADSLGLQYQVNNGKYQQSFIVSTTSGLNPSVSAPIQVQYGGNNYSSISVVITAVPPSATTNGLKAYPIPKP
jgi:RHS repeat-associated protein